MLKTIPKFKNENEEFEFWESHDATDYFDFDNPIEFDVSKLKPSTEKVTIRLPRIMLDDLKVLANKQDVPYQSLMKIYLAQRINQEYYGKAPAN